MKQKAEFKEYKSKKALREDFDTKIMCVFLPHLVCRESVKGKEPNDKVCKKCGYHLRWLKQDKKILSADFQMV